MIGTGLGTALLIAAAWRAKLAPAWAAPIGLAGLVTIQQPSLTAAILGGATLLAAFGTVGGRLVLTSTTTGNAPDLA